MKIRVQIKILDYLSIKMFRAVLILCLMVATMSADYCEVTKDNAKIYIQDGQIRKFNLHSYIKGSDLTFEADNPIATIYSAYEVAMTKSMGLKDFTQLKSVDVKSWGSLAGLGTLSLLAKNSNNRDIAIWNGEFPGFQSLPDLSAFRSFTLPSNINATCYDIKSLNDQGDAVVNCQTIPQSKDQDPSDLLCVISLNDTDLNLGQNCNLISSFDVSLQRSSKVMKIGKRIYLLSVNKDEQEGEMSLDFITVYYLNQEGKFIFVNVIDGTQLTNPQLDITGFVVTNNQEIIVADSSRSRLIYFSYSVSNEVTVTKTVPLPSAPLALTYTDSNHLFVATRESINEHDASDPSILISKYEVDPNDNIITEVKASNSIVAFRTQSKNLFIYQRNEHKINYLLDQLQMTDSNMFILSQQLSYLYTFNLTNAQSISVSQPYLTINDIDSNDTLIVTGTSLTKTCEVTFHVKRVEDSSDIINKQNIEDESFMVDPTTGLSLNLKQYYGGANLKYKASQNTNNADFTTEIKQIDSYDIKGTFGNPQKSAILAIDSNSFYYVGINSIKQNMAYVDLCEKKNNKIECTNYWKSKNPFELNSAPVTLLETKMRSNGQGLIVWSFQYTTLICYFNTKTKGQGYSLIGEVEGLPISSIEIAEKYIIYVSKTARYINIIWNSGALIRIDQQKFQPEELKSLEYFYPRDIILDPNDPQIFYVKLPTRIARFMIISLTQVRFVDIIRDFQSYILDSEWTFTYTGSSLLTIRDKQLKEQFYNPSQQKYQVIQSLPFPSTSFSSIDYDRKTNFATVRTSPDANGLQTLKVLTPEEGSVDYQYVQMQLTGESRVSENWIIEHSTNSKVYYVNSAPVLSVTSDLPDDIFKEDIQVNIEVSTDTKSQTSKTKIQGVNFPVSIKDIPSSQVIKLPASANNVEMILNVEQFFKGNIAEYAIECPFCKDTKIELETSIELIKNITDLTAAVDYVAVNDTIVALSDNNLYLLSASFQIIDTSSIPKVSCNNMVYDQKAGLLLYCSSNQAASGQELLQYSIQQDQFSFENKYQIDVTSTIRQFDEMFVSQSQKGSTFVYILDNDETIDSNNKYSTVKVFKLDKGSLKAISEWNSATFEVEGNYPINDIDIDGTFLLLTIGNYGIGYGTITQGQLMEHNNIRLSTIPQIKDIFLTSSFFKQIQIIDFDHELLELSVFISSTNSLSFVANLLARQDKLIYNGITETYFRYGTQRLLNWHAVTDNHVYLSYYNQMKEEVTIVEYTRGLNNRTQFSEGVTLKLSKNQVKYHEAFVTNDQKLLVSHLTDVPKAGSLMAYNIKTAYYLKLNYSEGGDFKKIDVVASNDYHKTTHSQKIQFDSPVPPPPPPPPPPPTPDSDGLKWYVVVIVATVVLLLVGLAYGLFHYMKNKRSQKNISLLTQKQEVDADADSDENKESINPLEQRLNPTVVSNN